MMSISDYSNISCIVVGPIHYNTLNVLRSLGRNGLCPLLILVGSKKSNFVVASKYAKYYITISDYSEIVPCLQQLKRNINNQLPLIAINDKSIAAIDAKYNSLKDLFVLPNCKHLENQINVEMQKSRQIQIASKCGFNVPKSLVINTHENKINFDIPFPCIIKPVKSVDGTKSDMRVCKNQDEVFDHIASLKQTYKEVLIQQFIPNRHIYLIAGVRCNNGKIIIPGVIDKIKKGTRNNTLGLNAYGKLSPISGQLLRNCLHYLEEIDYYGLFSFEFANNSTSFFIELNLRSDGLLFFYDAAGISLASIWANDRMASTNSFHFDECFGINETVYISEFLKPSKFKDFITDFKRADCYSYFSKDDMHPFFKKFFKI